MAGISLADLTHFAKLYSPGDQGGPSYAFAGGSATQCWLHNSAWCREHRDIDIYAFNAASLTRYLGISLIQYPFFIGSVTKNGIVANPQVKAPRLHIIRGSYFDAEITPAIVDVRSILVEKTVIPVLSAEFIAVSKLSYPNVHRSNDFLDLLALNQSGCLSNADYLTSLLLRTSLGRLIEARDILKLKSRDELDHLTDFIHCQLIKRFLYSDHLIAEKLSPFQVFILLDIDDEELFDLPSEALGFIQKMLEGTVMNEPSHQIARLGLHFLLAGIPSQHLGVMDRADFRDLVQRGLTLIPNLDGDWLSATKNVLMTMKHLIDFTKLGDGQFNFVWYPETLVNIVQRILFDDSSRLTLLTSVRAIYYDFSSGEVSKSDCIDLLHSSLTTSSFNFHELNTNG